MSPDCKVLGTGYRPYRPRRIVYKLLQAGTCRRGAVSGVDTGTRRTPRRTPRRGDVVTPRRGAATRSRIMYQAGRIRRLACATRSRARSEAFGGAHDCYATLIRGRVTPRTTPRTPHHTTPHRDGYGYGYDAPHRTHPTRGEEPAGASGPAHPHPSGVAPGRGRVPVGAAPAGKIQPLDYGTKAL